MALLCKSLALASVGISCQTAHQLRAHRTLVSGIIGEPIEDCSTPFDWLLCPVSAAKKMILSDQYFPCERPALDSKARPYWQSMDVHFWHEQFEDWSAAARKAAHVKRNWERIASSDRKVFVLSNTQNNIARILADPPKKSGRKAYEPIDRRMIAGDVLQLFSALGKAFGQIELHCVSNERMAVQSPGITFHHLGPDKSDWEGNDKAWHEVIREILDATFNRRAAH